MIQVPNTKEKWLEIAGEFHSRWDFPHCLGALDGKHVIMRAPANSGTTFYNYKGTFSTVLLALVDAQYRFIYVDVGANGKMSDGGIFDRCSLNRALEQDTLNLPQAMPLPGGDMAVPYYMVADEAFPLKHYIMKPFPQRGLTFEQRVYNYRLSRARRIVENAFGILSHRFRIFQHPFTGNPKTLTYCILVACVLHNYLMKDRRYNPEDIADCEDVEHNVIEGSWREHGVNLPQIPPQGGKRYNDYSKSVRLELLTYVNDGGEGDMAWQYAML